MPTYDYACTQCDHAFEVVQAFTDDALTVCPQCGGRLRKVFGSVGVVFKGSGFYRTDSRSSASIPAGSSSESKSDSSASKSGSDGSSSSSDSSSGSSGSSGSTGSTAKGSSTSAA